MKKDIDFLKDMIFDSCYGYDQAIKGRAEQIKTLQPFCANDWATAIMNTDAFIGEVYQECKHNLKSWIDTLVVTNYKNTIDWIVLYWHNGQDFEDVLKYFKQVPIAIQTLIIESLKDGNMYAMDSLYMDKNDPGNTFKLEELEIKTARIVRKLENTMSLINPPHHPKPLLITDEELPSFKYVLLCDNAKKKEIISTIKSHTPLEKIQPKEIAIILCGLHKKEHVSIINIDELGRVWFDTFGYKSSLDSLQSSLQKYLGSKDMDTFVESNLSRIKIWEGKF